MAVTTTGNMASRKAAASAASARSPTRPDPPERSPTAKLRPSISSGASSPTSASTVGATSASCT